MSRTRSLRALRGLLCVGAIPPRRAPRRLTLAHPHTVAGHTLTRCCSAFLPVQGCGGREDGGRDKREEESRRRGTGLGAMVGAGIVLCASSRGEGGRDGGREGEDVMFSLSRPLQEMTETSQLQQRMETPL